MTLLFRLLYAAHASGSHHKIALRALTVLENPDAEKWRRLFLAKAPMLLEGAKAPDKSFKDFANHVLHPADPSGGGAARDWGGAPDKVEQWWAQLVADLSARRWTKAAYAAGVMGHYYSDVWMPFHTGSSEEEGVLHRAVEWSASKSFETLWEIGALDPRATGFEAPAGAAPAEMTRAAARASHAHYRTLLAHYDYDIGVKAPESGLEPPAAEALGRMLAQCVNGLGHLLDRAVAEAGAAAPSVLLTPKLAAAALQIPSRWVLKRIEDVQTRRAVGAIYDELERTGRVVARLPEEVRVVQTARAAAVERRRGATEASETAEDNPIKARLQAGLQAQRASGPRADASRERRLDVAASVERAPSIGKKTAARLEAIGVKTVADLLAADPAVVARKLNDSRLPAETVTDWRDQARLLTEIAGLTQAFSVMLVAAGFRDVASVACVDAETLRDAMDRAAADPRVKRALRSSKPPELARAVKIVEAARAARVAA